MSSLNVITSPGAGWQLEAGTVDTFRKTMRGPVVSPAEAGYDDVRKVWNGLIDRRPALIARCTGAAYVIKAVNLWRRDARDKTRSERVWQPSDAFPLQRRCHLGRSKAIGVDLRLVAGPNRRAEAALLGLPLRQLLWLRRRRGEVGSRHLRPELRTAGAL